MTLPDPISIEANAPHWLLGLIDVGGLAILFLLLIAAYFALKDIPK